MFCMRCGFKSRTVVLAAAVASMLCGFSTAYLPAAEPAGLSFEERLAGHRAIEEVAWKHRIWPAGNPGPKPGFAASMPAEFLRARVDDGLRLSAALRDYWRRPITAEDLQREIDRMVHSTAWPSVLDELFDALGRDPVLVAECLARPQVAERLARQLYASDTRAHGALAKRVRREVENLSGLDGLRYTSGRYNEREWVRYGVDRSKWQAMAEQGARERLILDPGAWQRLGEELEVDLGGVGIGEVSPVKETAEAFSVRAVLERNDGRLRVATVVWPKREFDAWWSGQREAFSPDVESVAEICQLPVVTKADSRGNTWMDTTDTNNPQPRAYHTTTWSGYAMVVWGGTDGQGVFHNGYRYFPASDFWMLMDSDGRPTARAYHSAAWDGTYVVIWGGWNSSGGYESDGALYRPSTNTWVAMTATSAPSARREHTATWDGNSMVVFGGWDGTYKGVGGRWNIATDWSSMASANAPSARIGHASVFCEDTSGPVVIWGGENAGGVLNSGREYDSTANSWETMPTGLTARTGHSGVYMSSYYAGSYYKGQRRVVFWGGNTGSSTTTSGMGYDPVTNQWSNVITTTIEARQGHTAIANNWTMIVWGGFSGSTLYKTGGIYNPVNNVWQSTFTIGAPTARSGHTAIWRSEPSTFDQEGQMIVWGGEDATDYCDTGGLYLPMSDIFLGVSPDEFEAVPGGIEFAAVEAHIYSLNGFTGDVTLSCDPSYQVDCTFEENPVTMTANGAKGVDINIYPDRDLFMTDYTILIGATHDDPRGYQVKMKMQDFDVTCSPATVSVPAGGSVNVQCTVSSERGFDDPVALSCEDPYTDCTFSPGSVTPPANGTAVSTLTIEPVFTSGSWTQTVRAYSHYAYRNFDVEVNVGQDLIFADGFDTGSTSAWSATVD